MLPTEVVDFTTKFKTQTFFKCLRILVLSDPTLPPLIQTTRSESKIYCKGENQKKETRRLTDLMDTFKYSPLSYQIIRRKGLHKP